MTEQEVMYRRILNAIEGDASVTVTEYRELLVYMHDLIYVLCEEIKQLEVLANADSSTVH